MNNGQYFYRNLSLNAPRKPYIRCCNTYTTARREDLSFPQSPHCGLLAEILSTPYCYHSLLLIILVLAICRRPQSQQRNKNEDERVRFFFFWFFFFQFQDDEHILFLCKYIKRVINFKKNGFFFLI